MNPTEKPLVHIAIIPDGNRRWAKDKNLPTVEGHRVGAENTLPDLIEHADKLGIKYLTFWALSPENLAYRSSFELNSLFKILKNFVEKRLEEFNKKGVKLLTIGNVQKLPSDLQKAIQVAVGKTKDNSKITLILALNYGGRDEIVRAINKWKESDLGAKDINKEIFSSFMDTAGIPDPELIIRTGGEQRLSGFLLWQNEYAELYFSLKYFPDFTPAELDEAIEEYHHRQRRFGK